MKDELILATKHGLEVGNRFHFRGYSVLHSKAFEQVKDVGSGERSGTVYLE